MIVLDSTLQALIAKNHVKKASRRSSEKKLSFLKKTDLEANKSEAMTETFSVTENSSILFLQEIDQKNPEQSSLDSFAKEAFKILGELQISLLNNSVSEQELKRLKSALEFGKTTFTDTTIAALANDIKTRIEVEIAKIEVNRASR